MEREAHAATKKRLEYLTALVESGGQGAGDRGLQPLERGEDDNDGGGEALKEPEEEGISTGSHHVHDAAHGDDHGPAVLEADSTVPMDEDRVYEVEEDMHTGNVSGEVAEGQCRATKEGGEGSMSNIATRIRRAPRARRPSGMQTSPYVNPDDAVRKRRCGVVYQVRKRARKHATTMDTSQSLQTASAEPLVEGPTVASTCAPYPQAQQV